MRVFLLISLFIWAGNAFCQSNFAQPGAHPVSDRSVQFSDAGLSNPSVTMKVYYPATATGSNQPVASGTFPTVAFGHGFNLSFDDYNQICSHLASWGYVVMSPDVQNGFSVDHQEYARQLAATLNFMQAEGSNAASDFYQHIDSHTGVFGHSMGGGASGLVHTVYPGIDAVSGLAAAETNPSAIAALASYSGPFQAIAASQDNVAPENTNQTPMYQATTGAKHYLSIVGGGHCKFTDGATICDFVSGAGTITRQEQVDITKKYIVPFFHYYLKNDAAALPYLCGDSITADQTAGLVTFQTNISCTVHADEENSSHGAVYPNPTRGLTSLRTEGPFTVEDLSGRIILQGEVSSQDAVQIDLSSHPKGVYLLRSEGSKPVKILRL